MDNKFNQRCLIIILFLVITIDTMGIGFVWPLFGPLFISKTSTLFGNSASIEWRNILYGITIDTASLTAFISSPILGNLSDRIGRKKILLFCLFGTAVGMCISALGVIYSLIVLIIFSRAWLGAIAGSQAIAQAAIIDISDTKNKSARIGIMSAANNIGFIFGPIIGGLLIDKTLVGWFSYTTPFYFAAILALIGALLLWIFFKEKRGAPSANTKHFSPKPFIFIKAFTSKYIRIPVFTYFCLQVGWALYLQTNFVALIQKFDYSSKILGYFLGCLGIVFCFNLLLTVRWLTRIVELKTIIYTSLGIASLCCLSLAIHNSKTWIWISVLPMATVIALGSNATLTTLSNLALKHEQGWAMGIGNSLAALAWGFTPPLVGMMLKFGFSFPLIISGIVFIIATTTAAYSSKI